jgi:hypothetical protein
MADATTTQLLTLLNVSALKHSKRKTPDEPFIPALKLNKRKAARFESETGSEDPAVEKRNINVKHNDTANEDIRGETVEAENDDDEGGVGELCPSTNASMKA